MRRVTAATLDEGLQALDLLLGHAGGWMPVERRADTVTKTWWHRCGVRGSGDLLARTVRLLDERWSCEIRLGLPQSRRFNGGASWSTILWAVVSGSEEVRRARAFRPFPTLVLQEGSSSRRTLVWALDQRVGWQECKDANRRIAYRLGAVQKAGDPDALWLPAPGTFIRVGKTRPVPVVVTRLTTDSYRARQVVGRLKDPPDGAWWERRSEGSR